MTERRAGSGGTEDNVRDEFEEATKGDRREEDATAKTGEKEEKAAGTGGVKDNVRDEWDESQRR